jgi:hypothetical protein
LVAFLVDTGRTATTPEGLTIELANAFIGWLSEKRTGRNELLQENSRAKRFHCEIGLDPRRGELEGSIAKIGLDLRKGELGGVRLEVRRPC